MSDAGQQVGASLLLVDDDEVLAAMLREFLELQGFRVATVTDGESALVRVEKSPPDLVVLDVMLPGISGFEVLKRLRERRDLPIVMLTARGEESERIIGLLGGADDYLPKPFNPLELTARIQAVLKRSQGGTPRAVVGELAVGPLRLDLRRRELLARGAPVAVTAAEMRVLEQLMRRPGEVLSRARLTELALDRPIEAYDRSIDTLISRLRRKLLAAGVPGDCIQGLRGHGYVLDPATGEQD
ncbi:MAG: response regulator transcription factor [Gammaproteobacteria bacterium]|nr:response regulator transcription factor [Gammaproteobacteria bacterium]